MNHVVAYELLTAELANYREMPYEDLSHLVGTPLSRLVRRDGVDYNWLRRFHGSCHRNVTKVPWSFSSSSSSSDWRRFEDEDEDEND